MSCTYLQTYRIGYTRKSALKIWTYVLGKVNRSWLTIVESWFFRRNHHFWEHSHHNVNSIVIKSTTVKVRHIFLRTLISITSNNLIIKQCSFFDTVHLQVENKYDLFHSYTPWNKQTLKTEKIASLNWGLF